MILEKIIPHKFLHQEHPMVQLEMGTSNNKKSWEAAPPSGSSHITGNMLKAYLSVSSLKQLIVSAAVTTLQVRK